jgi:hypothetical protein
MGLADKLEKIQDQVLGTKCTYVLMLENMPDEERKALESAWDKGYSQRIILRALRSEGYKTSNEAIANHKSGNCKCKKA